jgi:hypothetical protein
MQPSEEKQRALEDLINRVEVRQYFLAHGSLSELEEAIKNAVLELSTRLTTTGEVYEELWNLLCELADRRSKKGYYLVEPARDASLAASEMMRGAQYISARLTSEREQFKKLGAAMRNAKTVEKRRTFIKKLAAEKALT